MHRRQFCISGAAVAAGLAAGRALPAAIRPIDPPAVDGPKPYKVIFDARYAASRAYGLAAVGAGRMTAAICGDVTALWSTDLRLRWASGRTPIAGMTTAPSFFCLQQLAKDHWMRAVVLAEHPPVGQDPRLVSWLIS